MSYRHRQIGWPLVILADALFIGGVVLLVVGGAAFVTGIVLLATAAIVLPLSMLTVSVDATAVTASFLVGWPRRSISIGEISHASRVRNRAWWGLGVRKIPGGWMYNVGGLDAVEIVQRSGKKFRIGTDQPDELTAALAASGASLQ